MPVTHEALLQTNPSSAQYSYVSLSLSLYSNYTRMFHQEPDNEIMVQLNQVYIYKKKNCEMCVPY